MIKICPLRKGHLSEASAVDDAASGAEARGLGELCLLAMPPLTVEDWKIS